MSPPAQTNSAESSSLEGHNSTGIEMVEGVFEKLPVKNFQSNTKEQAMFDCLGWEIKEKERVPEEQKMLNGQSHDHLAPPEPKNQPTCHTKTCHDLCPCRSCEDIGEDSTVDKIMPSVRLEDITPQQLFFDSIEEPKKQRPKRINNVKIKIRRHQSFEKCSVPVENGSFCDNEANAYNVIQGKLSSKSDQEIVYKTIKRSTNLPFRRKKRNRQEKSEVGKTIKVKEIKEGN